MWIPPRHVWHVTILFLIFQTSYYGLKSPALSGPFCLPNPSLWHIPFTPSSLHWPLFTSVCQALSSFRALAGVVPSFWKDRSINLFIHVPKFTAMWTIYPLENFIWVPLCVRVIRVTNSSWFAWDFSGFSTKSPVLNPLVLGQTWMVGHPRQDCFTELHNSNLICNQIFLK